MTRIQDLTERPDELVESGLRQHSQMKPPPLKMARLIHEARGVPGWSDRRIAKCLNKSPGWVSRIASLLELPGEVRDMIESGKLGWSVAQALMIKLPNPELIEFAREAAKRNWTREEIRSTIVERYPSALDDEAIAADSEGGSTPDAPEPDRPQGGLIGNGLKPYRLTVRQFERMIDAGVFPESHDVELLGGILVDKMTKYEPHNFAIARLGDDLRRVLSDEWAVREEKPVRVGALWRPEPDLAVVRGPHERYAREVPDVADIGILVEAADSSYQKDRGSKWARYAAAGVPTYWIINIPGRALEVYSDPTGRGRSASYRDVKTFRAGEDVPVMLDGREAGRVVVRFLLY